jgi:hypothetical protein
MQSMYYIGLDVHKRRISYCVKDESRQTGQVVSVSGFPVIRSEWEIRGYFVTQAIARARPSHNEQVELLYQRMTRRARSVFQRLAPPTSVSISSGICSG